MYKRLSIAMFVDAFGWDVMSARPWFLDEMLHRQPVQSVFGFSSACVPSILTGQLPQANDHWSCFYYSPETSPFRFLRHMRSLPPSLANRGRVRRYLSKAIAAAYGYTGYFQLYNVPFEALPWFDYGEKRDIFVPGGINKGRSIFDDLVDLRIAHHVSDWRAGECENFAALQQRIKESQIRFAFLYTGRLDGLLHAVTRESAKIDEKLRWYQREIRSLLRLAACHYDDVRFALFSDHGMANVSRVVNLMPLVEKLGLRFGSDYAAIYDSTMIRFWFLKDGARERVRNAVQDGELGRWLTDDDLRSYGTFWQDRKFGHEVYALEPGVLLNPSHMGNVPPAGMHGYRPDHPDSDSGLLSSFAPGPGVRRIIDLYGLMLDMARWAHEAERDREPQLRIEPSVLGTGA